MRLPQVLTQDLPSYAALKTHDIARPNRLSYRNCRCPGWLWFKVFTERDQGLIYGIDDSRYVSRGNVVIFERSWSGAGNQARAEIHPGRLPNTARSSRKLSTELRRIRRRKTTRPDASKPARLHEFLPRSMPRTTMSIGPLLYLSKGQR